MKVEVEQIGFLSYVLGSIIVGSYLDSNIGFKGDLDILRLMVGYFYLTDFVF